MALAGLNIVNLAELNTFPQIISFLLVMMGSTILVSSVEVYVRRRAFERKSQAIANQKAKRCRPEIAAERRLFSTLPIAETHSMSRTGTDGQRPRGRNPRTDYSINGVVTNGNADGAGK
ncbi:-domain-containing protein [Lasallia pustulata]|uniref:-domain-containing protein n=1 Tax=Lasallia pustulata TaxID=136370 RepID=A0A1W5D756_9LECA|nr:-domain-containing protein [Lasallia pustulata]